MAKWLESRGKAVEGWLDGPLADGPGGTIRPRRANFFAHRAQHSATVKPPSPLLAPEQQPLKPTTPLRPKNAPKTPVSHP